MASRTQLKRQRRQERQKRREDLEQQTVANTQDWAVIYDVWRLIIPHLDTSGVLSLKETCRDLYELVGPILVLRDQYGTLQWFPSIFRNKLVQLTKEKGGIDKGTMVTLQEARRIVDNLIVDYNIRHAEGTVVPIMTVVIDRLIFVSQKYYCLEYIRELVADMGRIRTSVDHKSFNIVQLINFSDSLRKFMNSVLLGVYTVTCNGKSYSIKSIETTQQQPCAKCIGRRGLKINFACDYLYYELVHCRSCFLEDP